MAKTAGRLFFIKKDATTIGGLRNVSVTVNGSPINVEDQGDLGFQTLLADTITGRSIEINGDGLETDQVLRDIAFATSATGKFMSDLTIEFPNGDAVSGDWFFSTYGETGPYEDAQSFTCSFTSDGEWTYTPAV